MFTCVRQYFLIPDSIKELWEMWFYLQRLHNPAKVATCLVFIVNEDIKNDKRQKTQLPFSVKKRKKEKKELMKKKEKKIDRQQMEIWKMELQ